MSSLARNPSTKNTLVSRIDEGHHDQEGDDRINKLENLKKSLEFDSNLSVVSRKQKYLNVAAASLLPNESLPLIADLKYSD